MEHFVTLSGLVAVFETLKSSFTTYFDRKDTIRDNLNDVHRLINTYGTLRDMLQDLHLQPAFDDVTQNLIGIHLQIITSNERSLQSLKGDVPRAKISHRVNRMKKDLESCQLAAEKAIEFLTTQVVPVLKERQTDHSHNDYVYRPDNNVPPNPPRLTLDYSTTATCEGKLKAAVLEEDESRVVGVVALGMGGVGKTCALRGLADNDDVKQRFPGGVLYIQLGNDAKLSTIIQGIATMVERTGNPSLAERLQTETRLQEAVDKASTWFRDQTCLFLVDDIWLAHGIKTSVLGFLETMMNERSRLVYTTRSKQVMNAFDKDRVIEFSPKETHDKMARRMLMNHAGFDCEKNLNERNERAVRGILQICNGLPLAIGVVGETVLTRSRGRLDDIANAWNHVYERIRSRTQSIADDVIEAYGSVRLIVDTSLDVLQSEHNDIRFDEMFCALCVLEKQQMVPIHMLQKLWGMSDLESTEHIVEKLDEVSLIRKMFGGRLVLIQLHDVILDIAIRKASERDGVRKYWKALVDNYIAHDRREQEDEDERRSSANQVEASHGRRRRALMRWCNRLRCVNVTENINEDSGQQNKVAHQSTCDQHETWAWWKTANDGYIHDNVCRALRGAGYEKHLLWLLSKPQWIVSRVQNEGIHAVEQDLDVGKAVACGSEYKDKSLCKYLEMISRAVRMSYTEVAKRKHEAWFQIHGRLLWYQTQCKRTRQFVEEIEQCAPRPWVKASIGYLEQAGTAAAEVLTCPGEPLALQFDQTKVSFFFLEHTRRFVLSQYSFWSGETESHSYNLTGFDGEELRPIDCQMSHDLNTVVISLEEDEVVVWNLEVNERKHWFARGIRCTTLNPDGTQVVCGLLDGRLQVRELQTGEPEGQPFVGHTDTVECVAWSGDGKRVASSSRDKTVRVWEVESGECVGRLLVSDKPWMTCVALSWDGRRVVSGSTDNTVRLWEVESGQPVGQPLFGHTSLPRAVAWSEDGRRVVSGACDGTVRVWEVESWERVEQPLVGRTKEVRCFAWSGDGRRVVTGSEDKTVRVWEVTSSKGAGRTSCGHTKWVACAAWSKDGRCVTPWSPENTVRVLEVKSWKPVGRLLAGHTQWVTCVAWSKDERRVASGSWDRTVRVWEVESGEPVGGPLVGHTAAVTFVGWSGDGRRVVSASDDRTVWVWDVQSGQAVRGPLRVLRFPVALNDDGSRLLFHAEDRTRVEVAVAGGDVPRAVCGNCGA